MSVKVTDRIIGPPRGTAAEAIAYALAHGALRLGEVTSYINEVYRLAPLVGIDPAIVVSQSSNETDMWRSNWWRDRLNPAGIGITGDPTENAASKTWANGADAARAQIVHLCAYVYGSVSDPSRQVLLPYLRLDPRWNNVFDAGFMGSVRTIADLAGKWAVDPDYAAAIVEKSRILFPNVPDQIGDTPVADLTFGKVPHPTFTDRPIPDSDAWDNLGRRTVRAVVWHRMLGSLWGTDGFFRGEARGSALTDYGVGVLDQDGASHDGEILRWNDPRGTRSPWANGRVSAPYGDGLAFVNRYGIDAVNRDATAIEISGFQNTALSEKSRNAVCGITAYWADQAKIPWDTFPAVPGENRSFVIWHQEFTIGTGKECPFAVVMNETNALIERTRAILKKYQAGTTVTPTPPTYADPIIPDWLTADLKDGKPNDHIWTVKIDGKDTRVEVFAAHRPFTMVKGANRLQLPFAGAKKVGPRLEMRETFMGRYAARVGTKVWIQPEYGTWIDNAAMTPRISIRKA